MTENVPLLHRLYAKSLKRLHPLVWKAFSAYLSKPRNYRHGDIILRVMPGVFHPGFFYSTKVLLHFVEKLELRGKRILELGAGSGLIAISCAKNGASAVATDINRTALEWVEKNAVRNGVKVETVYSNLFDQVSPTDFDYIFINPPYYPKKPQNDSKKAWYCGENFEYFHKLFNQLSEGRPFGKIYIILAENCDLERIHTIANDCGIILELVHEKYVRGELNIIFEAI